MKHSARIIFILLGMFLLTQVIGLFVIAHYSPQIFKVTDDSGNVQTVTTYNLPFGMDPPKEEQARSVTDIVFSFAIVFAIAIFIMMFLMKFKADFLIRTWFFVVVTLAIGISLNSFISNVAYSSLTAIILALPLSFFKIFKRNILVHNITELLIYPGIAAIFVALISSWTSRTVLAVSIILVIISLYDMYAVWHAGFMQKMAQYQIKNLKLFAGFFVPYLGSKQRKQLVKLRKSNSAKLNHKKFKVNVAILGGGDVVFPIILAGVVFHAMGLISALIISTGATLALAGLFYLSEKGKFYPAMPFISFGCFVALGIAYLL